MTSFPDTYCAKLDDLEVTAKTAYYISRGLQYLEKRVVQELISGL